MPTLLAPLHEWHAVCSLEKPVMQAHACLVWLQGRVMLTRRCLGQAVAFRNSSASSW